uniref:Uncharacterized protein n=1 Tax=Caulobacter sp. (strain K31) TaxID=366602 RepID=B0T6B8_CAUSK
MRALLISLLVFSVPATALSQGSGAQETPVVTAPAAAPATEPAVVPVVPAPPATQDGAMSATEATDPLADLIAQTGPQTTDEEESAAPQAPPPPHRPTVLPIPPPDPDEIPGHAIPPGGYVPTAEAYDLRIKGSILAAQGLQGPLDGGWAIDGADGATLYALQIVDKVGGYDGLEGAWRDVRRIGAVGSTGLIDFVDRSSDGFLARFTPRPGQLATLDLRPRGDGTWSGKLNESGVETLVTAHRVAQATLPPGYVPVGRGPVVWPRPVSAAPRIAAAEPARAPACSTKGKTGKALKAAKAKCAAAARKSGKGKGSAVKGKKGAKGKAVASKKGSKGKTTSKSAGKKKKQR